MGLACGQVRILQILVSGIERAKIQIADNVRLIRLVKNVSDREVIVFCDPVIKSKCVIPGGYRLINTHVSQSCSYLDSIRNWTHGNGCINGLRSKATEGSEGCILSVYAVQK